MERPEEGKGKGYEKTSMAFYDRRSPSPAVYSYFRDDIIVFTVDIPIWETPQFYVARDSLWRAGVGNEIWHSNQDTRPDFFSQMSNKNRWKIRLWGVILSCLSWLEKFFCVFSSGGICRYAQKQHMSDKMRKDFHCRLFGYFSFPWRYFCISKKMGLHDVLSQTLFFVVHCQRLNSFY